MNKSFLIALLVLSCLQSIAQQPYTTVLHNHVIIGENLITKQDIQATEYFFPHHIRNFYFDTITGYLSVQTREQFERGRQSIFGDLLIYDTESHSVKWSKEINYADGFILQSTRNLIENLRNRSHRLNIHNGENMWTIRNNIVIIDELNQIGMGYRTRPLNQITNTLQGIDMKSGDVLWQREVSHDLGWNGIYGINDTTIFIVAGGLHSINLLNGKGWSYEAVTGIKDHSASVLTTLAGLAFGAATGVFFWSTGYNLIGNLVSDILEDDNSIYFTCSEKITRFDKETGRIIWFNILPEGMAGTSRLIEYDSIVFLLNWGIAHRGNQIIHYGKPFLASFDKETGIRKDLRVFFDEKNSILDYEILDSLLFMIFRDKIVSFSLKSGRFLKEKPIDPEDTEGLVVFLGKHIYMLDEFDHFISIRETEPSKLFVITQNRKILQFDRDLNLLSQIQDKTFYRKHLKSNKLRFLAYENETIVVDSQNKKVTQLPINFNAMIFGDKLYAADGKKLLEIDLKQLFDTNTKP